VSSPVLFYLVVQDIIEAFSSCLPDVIRSTETIVLETLRPPVCIAHAKAPQFFVEPVAQGDKVLGRRVRDPIFRSTQRPWCEERIKPSSYFTANYFWRVSHVLWVLLYDRCTSLMERYAVCICE
jgi:hypothetical protein